MRHCSPAVELAKLNRISVSVSVMAPMYTSLMRPKNIT